MLPKLSKYGRADMQEFHGQHRPLKDHHSSMNNSSMHTRYLSYQEEPTEIGRLKKLKEFLCSEEDDS